MPIKRQLPGSPKGGQYAPSAAPDDVGLPSHGLRLAAQQQPRHDYRYQRADFYENSEALRGMLDGICASSTPPIDMKDASGGEEAWHKLGDLILIDDEICDKYLRECVAELNGNCLSNSEWAFDQVDMNSEPAERASEIETAVQEEMCSKEAMVSRDDETNRRMGDRIEKAWEWDKNLYWEHRVNVESAFEIVNSEDSFGYYG